MRTRTLTAIAVGLMVTGLSCNALALLPAIDGAPAMRLSLLVGLSAVFPWQVAHARQAAAVADSEREAARIQGYRLCLAHMRSGLFQAPPPATGGPGHHEPAAEPTDITRYARGHITVVSTLDHERAAQ